MCEQCLVRRAAQATRKHLANISTLDEWKRRGQEERKPLLSTLGLDPVPPKMALIPRPEHRLRKRPRLYVAGNLCLPDKPGRHPAIVYVSEHARAVGRQGA